ncbi:FkbM family methyltransferase [Streptomyces marianii]|uniref:FkbM family methyltransferase n=1 Tax=Streptomyces marianii TaxID=1817406 RepID=A0A5R9E920_9ACTN|nr:FkbM family methyltransferase [Streptomyces marianii]TLQ45282.1 FkbM family methyltransferase [Streptomyces marianii]
MRVETGGIAGVNRHETERLHEEIFAQRAYLRFGVTLPENSVVFDIGANIGMFSLFVRSVCPTASIYAFEPLPPLFAKLRQNVAAHARLFEYGLSDSEEEVTFSYYPDWSVMSARSAYADEVMDMAVIERIVSGRSGRPVTDADGTPTGSTGSLGNEMQSREYVCRVRVLSDVIDEQAVEHIDMLKIDVQRSELDVLNGIHDRHWPTIRQVVTEVHDAPGSPTSGRLGRIVTGLVGQGFQVAATQDPCLAGTDRYMVHAIRGELPRGTPR